MGRDLSPCPYCKKALGVQEDEQPGDSLRWFVCRFCSFVWPVAPRTVSQRELRDHAGGERDDGTDTEDIECRGARQIMIIPTRGPKRPSGTPSRLHPSHA
jgi:hypothetical protein